MNTSTLEDNSITEWIGKRLAFAAGSLAAVYAFSYILGYRYLLDFYRTLGASWAVDLYSPSAITQVPSAFAVLSTSFCIAIVIYLINETKFSPKLIILSTSLSAFLLIVDRLIKLYYQNYTSHWWIGSLLFGLTTIFLITTNAINEAIKVHGRNRATGFTIATIATLTFFFAPIVATFKANSIKASKGMKLPTVEITQKGNMSSWRLLAATPEGKLILINFHKNDQIEFRILDSKDVDSIAMQ